ncbi:MAG TPA: histidine--tRNA ligase [Polyangiaceae bacterium LLY-WYZ-15_(1-7)]|nr:histidine--tRNA ligase [Sandaracinus sp.]HJK92965.1 histidine--tRNA ligase [Polyangiaceae bacterium LLY-WYZ-15_(1-7)]MBJ72533.1 histidine--tRNA ligase [Sandaracinus sp.]HJL06346.1 histidine--tRNA ligase [Polyangiaceae bacterium LLY-WYZ-15_(1-7)]HJL08839.1 histidine--tRNA ligase [Polyangiaceae bacterium LLY-WYZ-15_(1-7)]
MAKLRSVKGMNDLLPAEIGRWHRVERTFERMAERYGFAEVRTPILEPTELFVRSIGEVTDIVEKEMYTFEDKGGKSLTLRPEGTASCARAYLQHNVPNLEPVSKWYYLGPMYRRERPAKGRYRQFYQAGCEVYGDPGPHCDAEMIDMVVRFLEALGVRDVEVLINSLGSGDTRERYREALLAYLRPHAAKLSEDSQRRLERNPLRVLDSKAAQDQEIAADAPRLIDHLGEEDAAHFEELKATLDALGTPYQVDSSLVRGLDYYTRTLFEVRGRGGDLGAQNTLCGGGRYDGMIRDFGGPPVPAIGFAMGIERLLLSMEEAEGEAALDAFLVVQAPELRRDAVVLLRKLRDAGFRADADLRGKSMKSQFRRADKSGARWALVLGEQEKAAGEVRVKDLRGDFEGNVADGDELIAKLRG